MCTDNSLTDILFAQAVYPRCTCLAEHMAGWESHFREGSWVPCRQHNAAILGIVLDFIDDLHIQHKLVYTYLSCNTVLAMLENADIVL